MRRILFSLSCTVFIGCVAFVVLPMMGALLRLVSVELAASALSYAIAYGPAYAGLLFVSFLGINALSE